MPSYRTCSECSNSMAGKRGDAVTCSKACRTARSRRLKAISQRKSQAHEMPDHQRLVTEITRHEVQDLAAPLVQEELRPVVREAITEDTLRAIQRMVALTPTAVAALEEDLSSTNDTVRQRAYTLLIKYTIGHPAVVRPEDADPNQQLVVNFSVPRPAPSRPHEPELDVAHEEVVDAEEVKDCAICGLTKTWPHEFVANSDRCADCHEKLLERARPFLERQEPDSAS